MAVLLVVAFHVRVAGFAGGFIGVDVFFVLSGWLITGQLLDEAERTYDVRLRRFWARRVRRLVPALSLTVVGTLLGAALVLSPLELARATREGMSAAIYVSNLELAQDATDYFAPKGEESLFLHMWSLGVEEQFYLVWPVAVWAVARLAQRRRLDVRRWAVGCFAAVTLGSLVLAIRLTQQGSPWSFYGLPARAWEFGAAGMLSATVAPGRSAQGRRTALRGIGPTAGFAALVWSTLQYTAATPYPGIPTVLPVIGTLAIIQWSVPTRGVGAVLSLGWLRWLGRLSYSWYLWHWPLILLAVAATRSDSVASRSLGATVALSLAYVTHRLVENRLRTSVRLQRTLLGTAAMGVAATVAVAAIAVGVRSYGDGQLDDPLQRRLQVAHDYVLDDPPSCVTARTRAGDEYCTYGNPSSPRTILLLGDSHAGQWLWGLERAARALDVRLVDRSFGGCLPVDAPVAVATTRLVVSEKCAPHRSATERVLAAEQPDLVIITVTSFRGRILDRDGLPSLEEQDDIVGRALVETTRTLLSTGAQVAFILDNPRPTSNPVLCVGRTDSVSACTPSTAEALEPVAWLNDLERQLSADLALPGPFDTPGLLCDQRECLIDDGQIFFYADADHLSAEYTVSLSTALEVWLYTALGGPSAH